MAKKRAHTNCVFSVISTAPQRNTTNLLPKVPHHNLIHDDEKRSWNCDDDDNKTDFLTFFAFLDAIASPSSYPCESVSGSVIDSFRLEITIASPSFASLFTLCYYGTIFSSAKSSYSINVSLFSLRAHSALVRFPNCHDFR